MTAVAETTVDSKSERREEPWVRLDPWSQPGVIERGKGWPGCVQKKIDWTSKAVKQGAGVDLSCKCGRKASCRFEFLGGGATGLSSN